MSKWRPGEKSNEISCSLDLIEIDSQNQYQNDGQMRHFFRSAVVIFLAASWAFLSACSLDKHEAPTDVTSLLFAGTLSGRESLGKEIFFDTALSEPAGQSCGTCHNPAAAFTTPTSGMDHGITAGILPGRTGFRNTPTAAYAAFSPIPFFDSDAGTWAGGQFLDHRADTLEDQAGAPFLNSVEMANTNRQMVVSKLARSPYAARFRAQYGSTIFSDTDRAYKAMTEAIAAFERSPAMNPFSSKFDAYLKGRAQLTQQELLGLSLFRDPAKGNCNACHPSTGESPLFTDFTNDNIGVPANIDNPYYSMPASINPDGTAFIDRGLGGTARVNDSAFDGRFKVPTLRNVSRTAPYMHNGVFADLRDVVRFYNTSCVADNPEGWNPPEVADTQNCSELGNLGLADEEIDAIVAFLRTLDDGFIQR